MTVDVAARVARGARRRRWDVPGRAAGSRGKVLTLSLGPLSDSSTNSTPLRIVAPSGVVASATTSGWVWTQFPPRFIPGAASVDTIRQRRLGCDVSARSPQAADMVRLL